MEAAGWKTAMAFGDVSTTSGASKFRGLRVDCEDPTGSKRCIGHIAQVYYLRLSSDSLQ